jgi:hypothetical protein
VAKKSVQIDEHLLTESLADGEQKGKKTFQPDLNRHRQGHLMNFMISSRLELETLCVRNMPQGQC